MRRQGKAPFGWRKDFPAEYSGPWLIQILLVRNLELGKGVATRMGVASLTIKPSLDHQQICVEGRLVCPP